MNKTIVVISLMLIALIKSEACPNGTGLEIKIKELWDQ